MHLTTSLQAWKLFRPPTRLLASLSPDTNFSVCDEGSRMFTNLLTYSCILLVVITFPVSIFFCVKHVQVITIIIDYKTPKQLREPLWVSKFVNKGIWAGCHLSAGSYASRRNTGARSINMIIIISPILVITTMIMIIYSQGIFFIIPCVDVYEKIDMRTQLFCVPPQEVRSDGLR